MDGNPTFVVKGYKMDALARLTAATTALAEAKTLDEVKHIVDIAEAARTYARAARLGLDAQNHAAEIKLRAERKAGEMLAAMDNSKPGPKVELGNVVLPNSTPTLGDLGVEKIQSSRWQAIAAIPDEVFEQHIAETVAERTELTSAGILRVAVSINRDQRNQEKREAPPLPSDKYRVWYADPPWEYGNAGVINETDGYGHAKRHYPTMSIDALCAMGLHIRQVCEPDAVLFMWVTSPLLEECFPVINAWGFKYKTSFVWDKIGHNYGHYNSVRHELLLVCTRGSCTPDSHELTDSVIGIQKTRTHSEKPEEFRRLIEGMYTWGKRIELFARMPVDGWDTWGSEVE